VEFFKDDTSRRCPGCGHRFVNPAMDFGCAAYCPFAEQCLGTLPAEALAQREDLFKDRVAVAMKRHHRQDFKRIGHAMRRARFAERIGKLEGGGLAVALIAAYLGDLAESDRRSMLEGLGARPELVDAVARLLAPDGPAAHGDGAIEWRILQDAERLAVLEEELRTRPAAGKTVPLELDAALLTASGRREAAALLNRAAGD
jgi:hypothetical protein